ncbi:EthD family reductase [Ruegeria sp. SCSIO 43209]|uniref:EthD family reductase n=1 Tax=Ruegeria sp. SCSIO 43209 TaxID=2793010 RepID=UPI00147FFB21|nr:EthD family reductase [Ruegeria sp. SCSIO 43209]UAB89273.1 EthD family reductase [Ruegeria sp. SCSIO 43209]
MSVSLQVIYPIGTETHFDFDYYVDTHLPLVGEHMGSHIERTVVTKGIAGGPEAPAGHYAIATIMFEDQDAMNDAMSKAGPVLADLPNFTNVKPQMLIGEVIG